MHTILTILILVLGCQMNVLSHLSQAFFGVSNVFNFLLKVLVLFCNLVKVNLTRKEAVKILICRNICMSLPTPSLNKRIKFLHKEEKQTRSWIESVIHLSSCGTYFVRIWGTGNIHLKHL